MNDESRQSKSFSQELDRYYKEKPNKSTEVIEYNYPIIVPNICPNEGCGRRYHPHEPKNVYGTFCYNCSVEKLYKKSPNK